jgi:glycosyltransferase involved in cell wall biosynthesis
VEDREITSGTLDLRQRLGWQDAFVLLSNRSWEPLYGVDVVAEAFVQAARQVPELRLVLLGNGSQAARLRQIFARGEVLDRVYFGGQVSNASLPPYYRSADLYLSASHSDGSSVSLLEALACGVPAVVSDIPGNREWITPGQEGWLFPDGQAGVLAQAILEAARDAERRSEMGRAARKLAERRANWKANFPKLLDAYRLALTESRKPAIGEAI